MATLHDKFGHKYRIESFSRLTKIGFVELIDYLSIFVQGLPEVEGAEVVLVHAEVDDAQVVVVHGGHMLASLVGGPL